MQIVRMWWERLSKFASHHNQQLKQSKFCISVTSAFRHLTIVSSCTNYKKGNFLVPRWDACDAFSTTFTQCGTQYKLLVLSWWPCIKVSIEISVECPKCFFFPSKTSNKKAWNASHNLKRLIWLVWFDEIKGFQGLLHVKEHAVLTRTFYWTYKVFTQYYQVRSRLNVSSFPRKLWFLFCFCSHVLVCVQLSITCVKWSTGLITPSWKQQKTNICFAVQPLWTFSEVHLKSECSEKWQRASLSDRGRWTRGAECRHRVHSWRLYNTNIHDNKLKKIPHVKIHAMQTKS